MGELARAAVRRRLARLVPDDYPYPPPADPPMPDGGLVCHCGAVAGNAGAYASHLRSHRPIVHGTRAGYLRHRRRGEPPCRDCTDAHTAYNVRRRRQRRRQEVAS